MIIYIYTYIFFDVKMHNSAITQSSMWLFRNFKYEGENYQNQVSEAAYKGLKCFPISSVWGLVLLKVVFFFFFGKT